MSSVFRFLTSCGPPAEAVGVLTSAEDTAETAGHIGDCRVAEQVKEVVIG